MRSTGGSVQAGGTGVNPADARGRGGAAARKGREERAADGTWITAAHRYSGTYRLYECAVLPTSTTAGTGAGGAAAGRLRPRASGRQGAARRGAEDESSGRRTQCGTCGGKPREVLTGSQGPNPHGCSAASPLATRAQPGLQG